MGRAHLKRTVEEIDEYLEWLKDDISRYNLAFLGEIRETVVNRQERL